MHAAAQKEKTTLSLSRAETQEEVEEALKTFETVEAKCNIE
jgi:hypothetical protein